MTHPVVFHEQINKTSGSHKLIHHLFE
jgi:hypothetical protein